jgi:hypothetical protein
VTFQEDPNGGFEHFDNAAADVSVRAALASLETAGRLVPEAVIEAAASPTSPLHRYFTWDNTEAAHEYRKQQARKLIRVVRVVVHQEELRIVRPAYVRDVSQEPDQAGYISVQHVRGDAEQAKATVVYYFSQARGCLSRAVEIAEAVGCGEETKAALAAVDRLLRRLK